MANEKRLIDANDLEFALVGICDRESGIPLAVAEWLANVVRNAPTIDAVPVVRCKDCKFSSEDGGYDSIEQMRTHLNCRRIHSGFIGCAIVPKEGFCSYGERKDNG